MTILLASACLPDPEQTFNCSCWDKSGIWLEKKKEKRKKNIVLDRFFQANSPERRARAHPLPLSLLLLSYLPFIFSDTHPSNFCVDSVRMEHTQLTLNICNIHAYVSRSMTFVCVVLSGAHPTKDRKSVIYLGHQSPVSAASYLQVTGSFAAKKRKNKPRDIYAEDAFIGQPVRVSIATGTSTSSRLWDWRHEISSSSGDGVLTSR